MKNYTYFPGCSSSEGGAKAYGKSAITVSKKLGLELTELEDWNCCGSTPYSAMEELSSLCLSARNLALAEKKGQEMATPCSACYVILNRTNLLLKEYPELRARVAEALKAGKLEYHGTVKVRHIFDIVVNDVGYEAIKAGVTKPLNGLKVAAYYGCQLVRPTPSFDHPEYPESMEKLIDALGGEPVHFPLKSRCCGGSLIIPEEALALDLIRKILDSAVSNGAECMITVCPLCQTNLDAYQKRVNKKLKTRFNLPILFFTQLVGIALGLSEDDLDWKSCIVPAGRVLAKCL